MALYHSKYEASALDVEEKINIKDIFMQDKEAESLEASEMPPGDCIQCEARLQPSAAAARGGTG